MPSLLFCLVQRPFADRTFEEQVAIVRNGPPQFRLIPIIKGTNKRLAGDHFYERHGWLTACRELQRCFCWPCLLLARDRDTPWAGACYGFVCVWESLPGRLREHEATAEHIEADLRLKLFRLRHVAPREGAVEEEGRREEARRRKEGLEALSEVVVAEMELESLFDPDATGRGRAGSERYLDLLRMSRDCFDGDPEGPERALELMEREPLAADVLTATMASALREEIKKEVEQSPFVSVILSELAVGQGTVLRCVSAVLRYVRGAEAVERFVGLFDLPRRNAGSVVIAVRSLVQQFGADERKLCGYALDGGVLRALQLERLVSDNPFPRAFFAPWHGHRAGDTLLQGLRGLHQCEAFAQTLATLRDFLRDESLRGLLPEAGGLSALGDRPLWGAGEDVVQGALVHRTELLQLFDRVLQRSAQFASADVARAYGLRLSLKQQQFVFLLCLFKNLSRLAQELQHLFEDPRLFLQAPHRMVDIVKDFNDFKANMFQTVCTEAVLVEALQVATAAFDGTSEWRIRYSRFQSLFCSVLDMLTVQLNLRLKPWHALRFTLLQQLRRDDWPRNYALSGLLAPLHGPYPDIYAEAMDLKESRQLALLCAALPLRPVPGSGACTLDAVQQWATGRSQDADRTLLGVEADLFGRLLERWVPRGAGVPMVLDPVPDEPTDKGQKTCGNSRCTRKQVDS